jgi:phenylpropionate dioxygenase-like ring-hydroxylating dioxygenase large terminal subunit
MFVKNSWYVAAFAAEIVHAISKRRLLSESIILWRSQHGAVVAMEDRCPHRRVPLSIASLVGDEVRCGYHGMQFDTGGRCTFVPGQNEPHPTARVKTYPVIEKQNLIWIWLGAAELAHAADVPDLPWLADSAWMPVTGYLNVAADYRLATDNLLDLSHETYVHSHTIGNQAVADNPAKVSVRENRLVRAHREIPDQEPPPFIAQTIGTSERINRWQTAIYMPPGVHMTEAGIYPVSRSRASAYLTRVLHLLTPETDNSTHYFWAMCRNYRLSDSSVGEQIKTGLDKTFGEDKDILELQAISLREAGNPDVPGAAIKVDEAPIRARRLLKAMVTQEQSDSSHIAPPIALIDTAMLSVA